MSQALIANRLTHSPCEGTDKVLLLLIAGELRIPDPGDFSAAVATGAGLGVDHQVQRQHRNGGGLLRLADLGDRAFPQTANPNRRADKASDYTRRLAGMPNATGQAYYPALLWEVDGGATRDRQHGTLTNRSSLWRIPLVNQSVLVPVPTSARKAADGATDKRWDGTWTVDQAWETARAALIERQVTAMAAADRDRAAAKYRTEHELDARADLPADVWDEIDPAIAAGVWDRYTEAWADVDEYLRRARSAQEHATRLALRDEEWHPIGAATRAAAATGTRGAGRRGRTGGVTNLHRAVEIPGSAHRTREIPGSVAREIPGSVAREIPGSVAWDFPAHAVGVAFGVASGGTSASDVAGAPPVTAAVAAVPALRAVTGETPVDEPFSDTPAAASSGSPVVDAPVPSVTTTPGSNTSEAAPARSTALAVLAAAGAIGDFEVEATAERVAVIEDHLAVGLSSRHLTAWMQRAAATRQADTGTGLVRTETAEDAWREFVRLALGYREQWGFPASAEAALAS